MFVKESLPVRGAWIEIEVEIAFKVVEGSRSL